MSFGDLFRAGKYKKELEELRNLMEKTRRMELHEIENQIEQAKRRMIEVEGEIKNRQGGVAELDRIIDMKRREVIVLDEELLMQECGVYTPQYDLQTSEMYKNRLDLIREQQKDMVKQGTAAAGSTTWTINNSKKEGERMVRDYVKLILRSFNNECDASIVGVKYSNIESIEKRINKAFETLNKLGDRMSINISDQYRRLKIDELHLVHEYQMKKQEEKEEQKRIREEMREEAKALKEIEEQKAKLAKEEKHFSNALADIDARMQATTNEAELKLLESEKADIQVRLDDVREKVADVSWREQNTRAGNVYIISNLGSFGQDVYKIGMTRRLDPMERVDELGDASVPFDFDVHAIIFSDDAPKLENALHKAFDDRKLNAINQRREFFHVTLEEIEHVVKENFQKPVDFVKIPDASEYRQSIALRNKVAPRL